mgnify:CR=1 FL=1
MKVRACVLLAVIVNILLPGLILGGWDLETIDDQGNCGQYNSLAIGTDNKPHVSYRVEKENIDDIFTYLEQMKNELDILHTKVADIDQLKSDVKMRRRIRGVTTAAHTARGNAGLFAACEWTAGVASQW